MLYLADLFDSINDGDIVPAMAIVGGLSVGALAIVFTTVKGMYVARQREQTKRELAAYVAEGTLDADKAIALIGADRQQWEVGKGCCGGSFAKTA